MLKYTYIKSFFDFFLSLIMITAFLPLMLLVFLILIIDINEFPFFIQKRPGFKGKVCWEKNKPKGCNQIFKSYLK